METRERDNVMAQTKNVASFLLVTDVTYHTLPGHLKVRLQHKVYMNSILIIALWSLFFQHHSYGEEGGLGWWRNTYYHLFFW